MKKILIEANGEIANKHIQQVETEYIARVAALAKAIEELGMGIPTKEQIIDAITNNSNNIESAYRQYNDLESKESKLASLLESEANKRLDNVHKYAEAINNSDAGIFNGMRINNPSLFDWFGITEDGKVYLLESVKESIRESVKIYTTTKKGIEMYGLQQSLAKDIQKMYDLMCSVDSDGEILNAHARSVLSFMFPLGLFDVKEDMETGHRTFVPKSINFDPEQVIVDED